MIDKRITPIIAPITIPAVTPGLDAEDGRGIEDAAAVWLAEA